jgi:hypothetical protein
MLQTAQAVFDAMMTDEMHSVRQTALGVFVKHPRRSEISKEQENILLR